jgi:hypothetical protein
MDAGHWLGRLQEAGVVSARSLEPLTLEGVAGWQVVLGRGERDDGRPLVVAFAPRSGADAVLAALAAGAACSAEGSFQNGVALAVTPVWGTLARRRLALAAPRSFAFEVRAAPALSENGEAGPDPEPVEGRPALAPEQVVAQLADPALRELFARASAGLAGLAAKHAGALRGAGSQLELVLLARRSAVLRADDGGVVLETLQPARSSDRLHDAGLADALDRLEGQLRKRLNDRAVREGEDGLRARALREVAAGAGLRVVAPWPLSGGELEVLDFLGVDADGRPVAVAIRRTLTLQALGPILDATFALRAALPVLLAGAAPPARVETPRLLLAAETFEDAALRVIGEIALEVAQMPLAGSQPPRTLSEARPLPGERREGGGRRRRGRGRRARRDERDFGPRAGGPPETRRDEFAEAEPDEAGGEDEEFEELGRGREAREHAPQAPEPRRFEELSAFDLVDEGSGDERPPAPARRGGPERGGDERRGDERRDDERRGGRHGRRRRRGRREGRGPRPPSLAGEEAGEEAEPEPELGAGEALASELVADDALEDGVPPVSEAPELEEAALAATPRYDDEEETEGEPDSEAERQRREREARRRARVAKAQPEPVAPAEPERPRRAAIVAHADRGSVAAALLFARDVRVLEGLWVYPQTELMTFFRSVATDLREDVPIFVIGFTARPAREVIQTASLYRGRLNWFDHHVWPPEDVEALRVAMGSEDALHVRSGLESPLPLVLARCSRRSRFSDKLVDLVTGRFSEHDFTRWGRLWWARIGSMVERHGDRRADVEPLLAGRPSDLAREAGRYEAPPAPPELAFAVERDFTLSHFGGYTLVRVPVPPELDLHLVARIARERHAAQLSLAWQEGGEALVLAGEGRGGRELDLVSMAEHLANKLAAAEALPDDDHVARVRVRDLPQRPGRVDEVVAEIAMGRSILEG